MLKPRFLFEERRHLSAYSASSTFMVCLLSSAELFGSAGCLGILSKVETFGWLAGDWQLRIWEADRRQMLADSRSAPGIANHDKSRVGRFRLFRKNHWAGQRVFDDGNKSGNQEPGRNDRGKSATTHKCSHQLSSPTYTGRRLFPCAPRMGSRALSACVTS